MLVSDSGSFESSQSSVNRDSGGSYHNRHRRRCPSASDQHQLSPQCNGAGDSMGDGAGDSVGDDDMSTHLPDDDVSAEDGLSAE